MKKVTVGIIGAGRIGQIHAQNLLHSNDYFLKGIADVQLTSLVGTRIEKEVPILTEHYESLLTDPDIDAIFICSPTDTHFSYIKEAAKQGKHIFCEKPISFNIDETREILQIVKETGIKFQVGFNRRFDPHFRKVYKVVRSGRVGTPQIIKITSRDPEYASEQYIKSSGGMFMDMTIHDFDMIRYLSGKEVVEVSVAASNLIDPVFEKYDDVDTAIITLKFEDGSLGVIDNSRQAVYGYDQRIEVFGNEGAVQAENERNTNIQIATKAFIEIDHPRYFFLDRYKEAYIQEVNEFAQAIVEDQPVICSVEDGYQAQLIALAAKKSYEENRPVALSELAVTPA